MRNLLLKYPIIYLLLFCFGSLVFGYEVSDVYKNGFPKEGFKYILKISGLLFNIILVLFFFFCFVKLRNKL